MHNTYPWFTESLRACIGLEILSLSSWDHFIAPATWGIFLLIGGVPSSFAKFICPSNITLAWSSSSSYILSRTGYLYSKSAWISGRSSKEPKQSRSYQEKIWFFYISCNFPNWNATKLKFILKLKPRYLNYLELLMVQSTGIWLI